MAPPPLPIACLALLLASLYRANAAGEPTIHHPTSGHTFSTLIPLSISDPEEAAAGSVTATFTRTSGGVDTNSPHVVVFAAPFESSGTHYTTLFSQALMLDQSGGGHNANVTWTSPSAVLLNGVTYKMELKYTKSSGGGTVSSEVTDIMIGAASPRGNWKERCTGILFVV
jgi:hypothetical protein